MRRLALVRQKSESKPATAGTADLDLRQAQYGNYKAGMSYSQSDGFGVVAGLTNSDGTKTVGIGYSEKSGVEAYAKVSSDSASGKLSYSKSEGFGVAVTAKTSYANASASFTQKSGLTVSVSKQMSTALTEGFRGNANAEVSYNTKTGFSASLGMTLTSTSPVYEKGKFGEVDNGSVSGNVRLDRTGFQGSTTVNTGQNLDIASNLSSMESSLDAMAERNREVVKEKAQAEADKDFKKKYKDVIPGVENMTSEEIAATRKSLAKDSGVVTDPLADGTSRESIGSEIFGALSDLGNIVTGNYRGGGNDFFIDAQGNYHQRTCFVKGTPVSTLSGKKPVEEIKDGDIVFAKDEKTGKIVLSKVQQTYIRKTDRIYKLEYEDGMVIETTPTHPFRIQRVESDGHITEDWIEARFLREGDRSVRINSRTLAISHIAFEDREETVYNFTVEENHNYFVGDAEVLVHNEEYAVEVKKVGAAGLKAANEAYLKYKDGDISKSEYEAQMKAIKSGKYVERSVGDTIFYPGSNATTNVGSGKIAKDESGKVTIDANKLAQPDNWEGIDKLNGNHVRVKDKIVAGIKVGEDRVEQTWRGDISSQKTWYGPASDFKVVNAGVMSPYGGVVDIQLSNGQKVRMGHFDKINVDVMNAYRKGESLPAGTYIGETGSKIGFTTGAHLHIKSLDQKFTRQQVLKWMQKK